jgi:hypothetical protein
VQVQVPKQISARAQELLKELQSELGHDNVKAKAAATPS